MSKFGFIGFFIAILFAGAVEAKEERHDYLAVGYGHWIQGGGVGLVSAKYGFDRGNNFYIETAFGFGVKDGDKDSTAWGSKDDFDDVFKLKHFAAVYAVKAKPISESSQLYIKGGLHFTKSEYKSTWKGNITTVHTEVDESQLAFSAGVGMNFNISETSAINVELLVPSIGEIADITELSISYLYRF